MWSFITAIAPMIVLFAIPVLIPIVAVTVGALADLVRPPRPSLAEEVVAAARARSAAERLATMPPPTPLLVRTTRPDQRPGGRAAA